MDKAMNCEPENVRKELDESVRTCEPEEVFEVDMSRVVANLGRRTATLIAKGVVQDHYNGDWNRVRFIGLEVI